MIMCLGVFLFGSNFFGILWASWKSIPFSTLRKFSFIICSNNFSISCRCFPSGTPYTSDIGMFQVVPEVPKPLFISLNSCFFILFWSDVYFFLLFQIIDLSPGFLPVTVGSVNILLYFICSFIFWPRSISSVSILITRALNSPSDRLAISSLLSSEVLLCSFIWAIFLCLGAVDKLWGGGTLGIHLGRITLFAALPVGEGPEREKCSSPALLQHTSQWTLVWDWEKLLLPQPQP